MPDHDALADAALLIVSDFGHVNGGAAQVAIQSAIGLRQHGVNVTFAFAADPVDPRLEAAGVVLRRIPFDDVWSKGNGLAAAMQGIWNAAAAAQLGEVLQHFDRRRTIVHFHQWTKCFSPSVLARSLALGFETVITMHDYFMTCPNGALYNFRAGEPCGLRPLSVRCVAADCDSRSRGHKMVRCARGVTQRLALSRVDAKPSIVHVSDFARRIAEPQSMARARHYTVTNPVVVERRERVPAERNDGFLFVGRLVPEKGCLDLARAARQAGLPVAFAGQGPMAAEISDINPAARLLGWLSPADLATLMRRSRALVFPSRWHETSGLVCLEALANGLPVIASTRTAAAGLIEDGVTGALFDPGDPTGLDRALATLRRDDTAECMSRRAYDRYWAAPASIDRHVAALIAVYREIVNGSAAGRA